MAVNQKTGTSYQGRMASFGVKGERADIPNDPELMGQIALEYFSVDLVPNLGIPIENATYSVSVRLGSVESNGLTIAIHIN